MPAPTLGLFDLNETLSDLGPLRRRFEEVGAAGELLEVWFASTLRDGFALTAARGYADFCTVALGVLPRPPRPDPDAARGCGGGGRVHTRRV